MSSPDPLDGVSPELRDWHQGALEGDLAVCGIPQPGRPDFPCIGNRQHIGDHHDVFGRTWPHEPPEVDEPLYVARLAAEPSNQRTIQYARDMHRLAANFDSRQATADEIADIVTGLRDAVEKLLNIFEEGRS